MFIRTYSGTDLLTGLACFPSTLQVTADLAYIVDRRDPRWHFRKLAQIGEGSTSVVDAAWRISDGSIFAVKKMVIFAHSWPHLMLNEVDFS